ncbi:DBH-like monooxygenase protein 1 isoform X2 [Tubulanus polymorphus]|uniref:DBH-like monooxygenase protein 1 isoform X2 n=1 Tax=Tubulanus polymorphus TaxID=672921 RepID=UPI003DA28548
MYSGQYLIFLSIYGLWMCELCNSDRFAHINSPSSRHFSSEEPIPRPTRSYINKHTLARGKIYLFWDFDEESMTFELHARTTGWLGFGLSSHGGMKGADMVVGWVTNSGHVHFQDMHASGRYRPKIDTSQDYHLLASGENEHFTMFKFRRKLLPCDDNDQQIKYGTSRIIYAWGDKDPESFITFPYHGKNRGSISLTLLDYNRPVQLQIHRELYMKYFDVRMDSDNLPHKDTIYWCKQFKLPEFSKKVHVIEIKPLIQPGHESLVHHILVYLCSSFVSHFSSRSGRQCLYDQMMPANVSTCEVVMFAYAIGMKGLVFPVNVGYPLGGDDPARYMLFEVHYDNPRMKKGIRDQSGLRFYYTERLRQHDAGVLEVGHTVWWPPMLIPPKAKEFRVDNYCSGSCTGKYIPVNGINLLAVMLHTHTSGHRIWMKHVRNGRELPEIARDNHYDFNYQQFRLLPKQIKVLPGDHLISTCTYRTSRRTNFTLGGTSTRDEMCIHFLMYYPKIKLTKCLSTMYEWLPIKKYVVDKVRSGEINFDPTQKTNNMFSYFNRIKWTNKETKKFQKVLDAVPQYREYCEQIGGGAGPMVSPKTTYRPKIRIKYPYVNNTTCSQPVSYGFRSRLSSAANRGRTSISSLLILLIIIPVMQ